MPAYSVDIQKDVVIKTSDANLMRVEVAKTISGYKIAESCGLFRVPKVLDYDEESGTVTLERLHNIEPLMPTIAYMKTHDNTLERIGQSLAAIHKNLTLPVDMKATLPSELMLPNKNQVFIHGDFNGTNVCVNKQDQTIAILDWQMTSVHGEIATYGTRYFDLTWLVNHLFYRPLHRYLFAQPAQPLANQFLQSYFKASNIDYPFQELHLYMKNFFEHKLECRKQELSPAKHLLLTPANNHLMDFLRAMNITDGQFE